MTREEVALSCGVPLECVPDNPDAMDEVDLTLTIEENLARYARLRSSPLWALVEESR